MINRFGAAAAACFVLMASAAGAQEAFTPGQFAQGLGTWQDRVLIEQALQRYIAGFDMNDPELFASAFAPDGVFEYNDDTFTGRREIGAFILGRLNGRPAGVVNRESRLFHVMTNSNIVFQDETHATHTAYGVTVGRTLEETHLSSSGSYTDELVKLDGDGWVIQRRVLEQLPVFNPNATTGPATAATP